MPERRCEPVTVNVQIDVQTKGRHLGHLGPVWSLTFPANAEECGPTPNPTPTPSPSPSPTPPTCEPEWTLDHSEFVWDDWGECHRDVVPDFTASNGGTCSQQREGTRFDVYTNQCDERTRTAPGVPVSDSQPCDCNEDEGLCHVSNKGGRDGQVNLVLHAPGHEQHLDSDKFCPPDLEGACSCEAAIEAAKACGIEADGGFFCKITGQ